MFGKWLHKHTMGNIQHDVVLIQEDYFERVPAIWRLQDFDTRLSTHDSICGYNIAAL